MNIEEIFLKVLRLSGYTKLHNLSKHLKTSFELCGKDMARTYLKIFILENYWLVVFMNWTNGSYYLQLDPSPNTPGLIIFISIFYFSNLSDQTTKKDSTLLNLEIKLNADSREINSIVTKLRLNKILDLFNQSLEVVPLLPFAGSSLKFSSNPFFITKGI